nr:MAG TPA: hypothetical protein [Caudoviricetes sp.]
MTYTDREKGLWVIPESFYYIVEHKRRLPDMG